MSMLCAYITSVHVAGRVLVYIRVVDNYLHSAANCMNQGFSPLDMSLSMLRTVIKVGMHINSG